MPTRIKFALNHIATPRLDSRAFIDLAASLGCVGVELRNDLADKKLADRPFFDGEAPAALGAYARDKGVRLLGLSEAYGFNVWSDAMRDMVALLIEQARESGAETISLIPRNDACFTSNVERLGALRAALAEILPMVKAAGILALIEPLGFTTSTLRSKAETVDAIAAVGGEGHFKLVHDTFHHHLAGGGPLFAAQTGIVHISGVVDRALAPKDMQDAHRILVDADDRLGNVAQVRALIDAGYSGAFSFEPFAPSVHTLADPRTALAASMDYIASRL